MGALEGCSECIKRVVKSGLVVGEIVGLMVGETVGLVVGLTVGEIVGLTVGLMVGEIVGLMVGETSGWRRHLPVVVIPLLWVY